MQNEVAQEQGQRFVSREGWIPGPWDCEPDNLFLDEKPLPLLARRSLGGAWFGAVGVDPRFRVQAAALRTALSTETRTLDLIEFPDTCPGKLDRNLVYLGYIYVSPDHLRPSEAHYLHDLPADMRESYQPQYITMRMALDNARALAVTLADLEMYA